MKLDAPAHVRGLRPENRGAWSWLALAIVLLATSAVRWRLLDVPLERDEGEYALAGQLMLQGIPPYSQVYNMKLPGTYVAYAAIEALLGESVADIHLGFLLVNAASVVLLFLIGRRLLGGNAAAPLAAAFYAVLSISPAVFGTSAHATHFVVLPTLGSVLLLLRVREDGGWAAAPAAGICAGLAFVMKQQGIFLAAFAWLFHAIVESRRPGLRAHVKLRRIAIFSLCLVAPLAVTCLWLWSAGVWRQFWFWAFQYAWQYATVVPAEQGWSHFRGVLPGLIAPCWPAWLLAGVGLAGLCFDRAATRPSAVLAGWTACAALTVLPGLYFRAHYFVPLLPCVALLAAYGCTVVGRLAARWSDHRIARVVPVAAGVAAIVLMVAQQRDFLFAMTSVQVSQSIYEVEPFVEAAEIARWIEAHSLPDDRIAVLGAEPEIYFLANRRPATGYIYVYGIWERHEYADRMARELIAEIETARPRFVVVEFVPERLQQWAQRFLDSGFRLVGLVDMTLDHTEYRWKEEIDLTRPTTGWVVTVWERREF